jgi:hypothetical protein
MNDSDKMIYETLMKCTGQAFIACFALHAHYMLAQNAVPDQFLTIVKSRYKSYMRFMERISEHSAHHGIQITVPGMDPTPHNLRIGDSLGDISKALATLLQIHKNIGSVCRATADNTISHTLKTLCGDLSNEIQMFCYEEARMANASMKSFSSTSWIYNIPVNFDQTAESDVSSAVASAVVGAEL